MEPARPHIRFQYRGSMTVFGWKMNSTSLKVVKHQKGIYCLLNNVNIEITHSLIYECKMQGSNLFVIFVFSVLAPVTSGLVNLVLGWVVWTEYNISCNHFPKSI